MVKKKYDHNLGLSACFRQPRATSHCSEPHGYPLAFELSFGANSLDGNDWVIDFGSLKPIKEFLVRSFDHRMVLASHDPALSDILNLYNKWNWQSPLILGAVGCEAFARYVYDYVNKWLHEVYSHDIETRGLRLLSVECREHGANCAIYLKDY